MGTYSKLVQTKPPSSEKEETQVVSESLTEKSATPPPSIPTTEKQESLLASMQANKHASKRASKRANKHVNLHDQTLALLAEKATYGFTFRYPPELFDLLEDILHTIRKRHKVKLTKNAIAVAAIVFLLSDYDAFGEESVLYQLLIEPPIETSTESQ